MALRCVVACRLPWYDKQTPGVFWQEPLHLGLCRIGGHPAGPTACPLSWRSGVAELSLELAWLATIHIVWTSVRFELWLRTLNTQ
jgi:hypothetical protein